MRGVLSAQTLYVIVMDVDREAEQDFDRWNEQEHLAERLACPGFLAASRYRLEDPPNIDGEAASTRHMTVYELSDAGALHSAEYRRRTANPTPWTTRMLPHLHVVLREVYLLRQHESSGGAAAG